MRPTDALITGFCKTPLLALRALAPLRRLRREGHLRSIQYVTWDSAELDPYIAPIAETGDVTVTRLPQPEASGNAGQRGIVYQIENLKAGLALLPGDGLVLKTRLDLVAHIDLLRAKIAGFDHLCAPVSRIAPNGVTMPEPVFANKMWLPWADSNQPFFCEDGCFLAAHADAARLVTVLTAQDRALLGAGPSLGAYAHVVRYARIFLERWPLFKAYLANYAHFINDFDYRMNVVKLLVDDGFFWHLIIAHAWILHSQFHIDAGRQGDVLFYANNCNKSADWSNMTGLKTTNPYDTIAAWRAGEQPGSAFLSVSRAFGRLVSDDWQRALFTAPLQDFPPETLRALMENAAASASGHLAGLEAEFYAKLAAHHAAYRHAHTPLAEAG